MASVVTADVAQLAEHNFRKVGVASAILAIGSVTVISHSSLVIS